MLAEEQQYHDLSSLPLEDTVVATNMLHDPDLIQLYKDTCEYIYKYELYMNMLKKKYIYISNQIYMIDFSRLKYIYSCRSPQLCAGNNGPI